MTPAAALVTDWPDWLGVHDDEPQRLDIADRVSAAAFSPWWERHDLWWSDLLFARPITWKHAGRDEWVPLPSPTGTVAPRRVRVPETVPLPPERPGRPRTHMRRVISVLIGWHQATTRQLAAWTGVNRVHLTNRVLRPLWQAGIITRGTFGTSYGRADYVWQLNPSDPLYHWLRQLDDDDWLNVTLGTIPQVPSLNHRHNLLVTELTLRAAETVPVTAVIGETHSTADRLFTDYTGPELRGDVTFIRSDGLRIVIEFIREQHEHGYIGKLATWGRYLGATKGPHHTGTVVCFVLAPHDIDQLGHRLRDHAAATLTAEGLADPATKVAATPRHVAIARTHITIAAWPDWFPHSHDLSDDFVRLTAHYLDPAGRWGTVNLADPQSYKFTPADPTLFAEPRRHAERLWCTPQAITNPTVTTPDD